MSRSAFDLVGGFDESFRHSDDVALCWLLALAGVDLVLVDSAVLRYRHRSTALGYLKQEWISGTDDVVLYRLFGHQGVPRPNPGFGYSNRYHLVLRTLKGAHPPTMLLRLGEVARRLGRVEGWRHERRMAQQRNRGKLSQFLPSW